jgi:hypothetical protein
MEVVIAYNGSSDDSQKIVKAESFVGHGKEQARSRLEVFTTLCLSSFYRSFKDSRWLV